MALPMETLASPRQWFSRKLVWLEHSCIPGYGGFGALFLLNPRLSCLLNLKATFPDSNWAPVKQQMDTDSSEVGVDEAGVLQVDEPVAFRLGELERTTTRSCQAFLCNDYRLTF